MDAEFAKVIEAVHQLPDGMGWGVLAICAINALSGLITAARRKP